jgi:putative oxidoreductase
MPMFRAVAGPSLASIFVVGGIDTLRNPTPKVQAAETFVSPLLEIAPQLSSTERVVKLDAATKIVAGIMLAFGQFPRLSSLALAASLVPTTLAGHRFWEESDPSRRAQQRLHFLKNASMLGGLMLAALDTEGRPSLAWWARRAPNAIRHAATDVRRDSALALHGMTDDVRAAASGLVHHTSPALPSATQVLVLGRPGRRFCGWLLSGPHSRPPARHGRSIGLVVGGELPLERRLLVPMHKAHGHRQEDRGVCQ